MCPATPARWRPNMRGPDGLGGALRGQRACVNAFGAVARPVAKPW